ncbi:hypothetical protein ACIOKD_09025 [Streptomyces sp. NPDC087844]|uniref:hypothetical protein n=1 Tax=Streptomyces sp. NPDC087844 TaxID=3365805 RepID=UPI0037FEA912
MMRDGMGARLRLLPWTTPEGAPCYLSTDDSGSRLSRMADELEADLLDSAEFVLTQAKPLLAERGVGGPGVALHGVRLAEALGDALRIAASRGARLPQETRE